MFNNLGTWFRRQSVGRKLTTTALIASGATLLAACTVFATYDYVNSRSRLIRDVTMERAIFNESTLRRRVSGDDELMSEVIRLFLDDLPVRLAAIKEAATSRNGVALRATAHALKGSAGNLSAVGLFESARVLERIGAESHMDAAEAAWRQLSIEATHIIDVLRRHADAERGPHSCGS